MIWSKTAHAQYSEFEVFTLFFSIFHSYFLTWMCQIICNTTRADLQNRTAFISLLNLSVNPKGPLVRSDTIEVLQNI